MNKLLFVLKSSLAIETSHKHFISLIKKNISSYVWERDHDPSLTLLIFFCFPGDRWFFCDVNLYLHCRHHPRVIGIHLVTAGATITASPWSASMLSEVRKRLTIVVIVLHYIGLPIRQSRRVTSPGEDWELHPDWQMMTCGNHWNHTTWTLP